MESLKFTWGGNIEYLSGQLARLLLLLVKFEGVLLLQVVRNRGLGPGEGIWLSSREDVENDPEDMASIGIKGQIDPSIHHQFTHIKEELLG